MRSICSLTLVFVLLQTASAFSPNLNDGGFNLAVDPASLSQKAVVSSQMGMTRRDTIKMPSQTPMVPWTVRRQLLECHHRLCDSLVFGYSSQLVVLFAPICTMKP